MRDWILALLVTKTGRRSRFQGHPGLRSELEVSLCYTRPDKQHIKWSYLKIWDSTEPMTMTQTTKIRMVTMGSREVAPGSKSRRCSCTGTGFASQHMVVHDHVWLWFLLLTSKDIPLRACAVQTHMRARHTQIKWTNLLKRSAHDPKRSCQNWMARHCQPLVSV